MIVSITKAAGLGSDTHLIHSLREQSAELLKLASNFSDVYDAFDIFCFYELLPWRFGSVVSQTRIQSLLCGWVDENMLSRL